MDDASLRASDADREQSLAALREHMVAGRLTLEEFCARVDAALRAGVAGELAQLHDDLPDALVKLPGSRRRPARFSAALFGHVVRRGRFRLRRWALAASAFGDLDFDLRDATMDQERASVTVLAAFGNVDIYVPEGVNVDVGGLTVFGHSRDWGRDAGQPDAPSIHVRVVGFAGTIDVWRVPRALRGSSYRQILRTLNDRRRPLPG
jgi:Domain of unknown function (DUF1707)/Cell wall-active antibiotics response 4TMS YvqF